MGYVVTFEQTDPLYTVDLSDPDESGDNGRAQDPRLLGLPPPRRRRPPPWHRPGRHAKRHDHGRPGVALRRRGPRAAGAPRRPRPLRRALELDRDRVGSPRLPLLPRALDGRRARPELRARRPAGRDRHVGRSRKRARPRSRSSRTRARSSARWSRARTSSPSRPGASGFGRSLSWGEHFLHLGCVAERHLFSQHRGMRKLIGTLSVLVLISAGVGGADAAPRGATCFGKPATIVRGSGDDRIYGTNFVDVIVAGGGDDVVAGKEGDDYICGGEGDDEVHGGDDTDHTDGGPGDDFVDGRRGVDDTLLGGSGEDQMLGGGVLNGGPGPDEIDSSLVRARGFDRRRQGRRRERHPLRRRVQRVRREASRR